MSSGREFREMRTVEQMSRDMARGLGRRRDVREPDLVVATRFRPISKNFRHDRLVLPELDRSLKELRDRGADIRRVRFEGELMGEFISRTRRKTLERPGNVRLTMEEKIKAAEDMRLPVVKGRVTFPDVRVEYRDRDGRDRDFDLEIVTRSYGRSAVAAKASAGFTIRGENKGAGGAHIRNETKAKSPIREKRQSW